MKRYSIERVNRLLRAAVVEAAGQSRRFIAAAVFLLLMATAWPAPAAVSYVVKKQDTLSSIARRYGVTVNDLIQANGIPRSGHVQVGQKLLIPGKEAPPVRPPQPAPAALPWVLQRTIERTRITPGRWDYIVIHHSATAMGSARSMDRYHREERHMENGLAYHFVIGNGRGMRDGEIHIGHRWLEQLNGGHLASEALNARSLGICLVGNFDKDRPTRRQLESLKALAESLMKRCDLTKAAIKIHQEINPIGTRCPGKLFDEAAFVRSLK